MFPLLWNKNKPTEPIENIVGGSGKLPDITLAKAQERYLKECKFGNTLAWKQAKHAGEHYVKFFGEKKGIREITVGDSEKLVKSLVQNGMKIDSAKAIRGKLGNLFRFLKNGKAPETLGPRHASFRDNQESDTIALKFKSAPIDMLANLIAPQYKGRFYEAKVEVKKQVLACPDGEIRIIQPMKSMVEDKLERTRFMVSVNAFLRESNLAWVIKWSPIEKVFFVAPKKKLAEFLKKGEK